MSTQSSSSNGFRRQTSLFDYFSKVDKGNSNTSTSNGTVDANTISNTSETTCTGDATATGVGRSGNSIPPHHKHTPSAGSFIGEVNNPFTGSLENEDTMDVEDAGDYFTRQQSNVGGVGNGGGDDGGDVGQQHVMEGTGVINAAAFPPVDSVMTEPDGSHSGSQAAMDTPRRPAVFNTPLAPSLCSGVPATSLDTSLPPPQYEEYIEQWGDHWVHLPCSQSNTHKTRSGDIVSKWSLIYAQLTRPIRKTEELVECIFRINPYWRGKWDMSTLVWYLQEHLKPEDRHHFFHVTLTGMAHLALALPRLVDRHLYLLKPKGTNKRVLSLPKRLVASLLCNAFFCTFPYRNSSHSPGSYYSEFPSINFNRLFGGSNTPGTSSAGKFDCLFHYFDCIVRDLPPEEARLEIHRRQVDIPDIHASAAPLTDLSVHIDGRIEDHLPLSTWHVDFANKRIGGGVIGRGCVQEEIYFLLCPELLITRLFVSELLPEESLLMIGAHRYSQYIGYASTFQYNGHFDDSTVYSIATPRILTAIDAVHFRSNERASQFDRHMIMRELMKAFIGFSGQPTLHSAGLIDEEPVCEARVVPCADSAIITGHWGCGAFGGDRQLKAMIQLVAAAEARRPTVYYTFGDVEFAEGLITVHSLLRERAIPTGRIVKALDEYAQHRATTNIDVFGLMVKLATDDLRPPRDITHYIAGSRSEYEGTQESHGPT